MDCVNRIHKMMMMAAAAATTTPSILKMFFALHCLLFVSIIFAADFRSKIASTIELEQEFHHIITLAEEYRSAFLRAAIKIKF